MKPKISFVLPIFNAEKYLNQCIDSIIRQKSSDWELVLVDDGSSDNSLNICKQYEKTDSRIKVFTQDNSGSATARNNGFINSCGEWVAFLDADDWIEDNYLTAIVPYLLDEYDFVMYSYNEIDNNKSKDMCMTDKEIILTRREMDLLVKDVIDTERRLYEVYTSRSQFWTKVYRRSFLCEFKIKADDELRMCQDVMYNLNVYSCANKAIFLPQRLYNYRILEDSTCHRYSDNQVERIMNLTRSMMDFIENKYKSNDDELLLNKRIMVSLVNCCILDFCHKKNPKSYKDRREDFMELKQLELFDNANKVSVIKSFSFKKQICMWLVKFNWFWAINLYLKR